MTRKKNGVKWEEGHALLGSLVGAVKETNELLMGALICVNRPDNVNRLGNLQTLKESGAVIKAVSEITAGFDKYLTEKSSGKWVAAEEYAAFLNKSVDCADGLTSLGQEAKKIEGLLNEH